MTCYRFGLNHPSYEAAVYADILAGHPTGGGGRQKRDDFGDFRGLAETAKWRHPRELLELFRGFASQE